MAATLELTRLDNLVGRLDVERAELTRQYTRVICSCSTQEERQVARATVQAKKAELKIAIDKLIAECDRWEKAAVADQMPEWYKAAMRTCGEDAEPCSHCGCTVYFDQACGPDDAGTRTYPRYYCVACWKERTE